MPPRTVKVPKECKMNFRQGVLPFIPEMGDHEEHLSIPGSRRKWQPTTAWDCACLPAAAAPVFVAAGQDNVPDIHVNLKCAVGREGSTYRLAVVLLSTLLTCNGLTIESRTFDNTDEMWQGAWDRLRCKPCTSKKHKSAHTCGKGKQAAKRTGCKGCKVGGKHVAHAPACTRRRNHAQLN
jgi:hypothetical protein